MNSNHASALVLDHQSSTFAGKALENEIRSFCKRSHLTPRESEILFLLVEGVVRIKDVADLLRLSPNTVNNHINSIFIKTQTRSKSRLLASLLKSVAEELQAVRVTRQSPRILLVEADGSLAYSLGRGLEERGARVAHARSSDEIDRKLSEFGPHFVVADLAILKDAGAFVSNVRSRLPAQTILLGFGAGISERWQAMNEGAIDLLPKTVSAAALYHSVLSRFIEDDSLRASFLDCDSLAIKKASSDFQLTVFNTGTGGIFVTEQQAEDLFGTALSVGEFAELQLRLDASVEPILVRCEVVWIRSGGNGLGGAGLRFIAIDREDQERLAVFIRQHLIVPYVPSGVGRALSADP